MQFRKCGLVDVLDRVLERGLFLDADLVITVAGVPLVAARVKAVVSSVETMLAHGLISEGALLSPRETPGELVE